MAQQPTRCVLILACLMAAACSRQGAASTQRLGSPVLAADAAVPSAPVYDPCPPGGAKCLIMPLGDSLTSGTDGQEGYRGELYRLLQSAGRPFDFVGTQPSGGYGSGQEGHPNAHIALLLGYLDIWIPMFNPHVVLLMIGVNDLDANYLDHVATYAMILDKFSQLIPKSLVVVSLIPTSSADSELTTAFNVALAKEVNTRMAAGKHFLLADVRSTIRVRDVSSDGIHPVHAGYVRIAQVWYSILSRFMHVP